MPIVYLDRPACKSTSSIQHVTVDGERFTHDRITCETGRILGSMDSYAKASLHWIKANLSADDCRAMAASLLLAADVLEGTAQSPQIAIIRDNFNAALAGGFSA